MSSRGIRIADWAQRIFTGLAICTTVYLGVNLYQGGSKMKVRAFPPMFRAVQTSIALTLLPALKEKLARDQDARRQQMEADLRRWAEEETQRKALMQGAVANGAVAPVSGKN